MVKMYAVLLWIVPLIRTILGFPIETQDPDVEMASDMEQVGGHFEGDLILDTTQKEMFQSDRTALIGPSYRWPNYTVYYSIQPGHFTTAQQKSIRLALEEIMLVSCVKFVQRTNQPDYVRVTGENSGCWSYLGRIGGVQQLNLQYDTSCMTKGTIIHEFLHSLGFVHMQSASDRDFYIKINWGSIQGGKAGNFDRYESTVIEDFGIPYDYDSIMHYHANAFTADGKATIIPYEQGVTIGQRVGMSFKDIKRLNHLYPDCH